MSGNLVDKIREKLDILAESAPKSKVMIVFDDAKQEQVDAIVAYAQEIGLEVSFEKKESIAESLKKAADVYPVNFVVKEAIDRFELEINAKRYESAISDSSKPFIESIKNFHDAEKTMRREQMKQMKYYQNKHWKK